MSKFKLINGGKADNFVVGKYEGVFDTSTLDVINEKIATCPGLDPSKRGAIKWDGVFVTAPERPLKYNVNETVGDKGMMIASNWRSDRNAFVMDMAEAAWKSEALKEVAKEYPYLLVAELNAFNPTTEECITNARTVNKYDFEAVYVQIFLGDSEGDVIVFAEKWGDKTVDSFNVIERATPKAGEAIAYDARQYFSCGYPLKSGSNKPKYNLVIFASKEEMATKVENKNMEN